MFDGKKIAVLEERIKGITQLLWILTRKQGGSVQFSNAELDEVPAGAQLRFRNYDDGLEINSTTGRAPVSTDIAAENGKVD